MMSDNFDLDVLCFGEALVDFFPVEVPARLEDAGLYRRHLGGAPANVAVGLGRLGARVALMTLVGPDAFGGFVVNRLAEEGVDVAHVGRHARAKTGVTFVAVGANGERSFLFFRHPSADLAIAESDVDAAACARARVFHLGSSTLSREPARAATWKALAAARAAGAIVSCDPNLRPHLWDDPAEARDLTTRLLSMSDVVKVSCDETEALVGTSDVAAAAAAIRRLGPSIVVVTSGPAGSYFDAPCGTGQLPAVGVRTVDSTGAGDAFVAGLLARLGAAFRRGTRPADLDLPTLRGAVALGNMLGSLCVTTPGATAGLPAKGRFTVED